MNQFTYISMKHAHHLYAKAAMERIPKHLTVDAKKMYLKICIEGIAYQSRHLIKQP